MEACKYCGSAGDHHRNCPVTALSKADTEKKKEHELRNLDTVDRIMTAGEGPLLDELRAFLRKEGMKDEDIDRSIEARKLRKRLHEKSERELEKRMSTDPRPTDEELRMGAYAEMIEPQVRDAVMAMRRKGYATRGSGFSDFNFQSVYLSEPDFKDLDPITKEKLESLHVKIKDAAVSFACEEIDEAAIKRQWDLIAAQLPDLGRPAPPLEAANITFARAAKKYAGHVYPRYQKHLGEGPAAGAEKEMTGGEKKVKEYVDRIIAGESKDAIIRDLPPSFVRGIEEGLKARRSEHAALRAKESREADAARIERVRRELGLPAEPAPYDARRVLTLVQSRIDAVKKEATKELYRKQYAEIDRPEQRRNLARNLFVARYEEYRTAQYPYDPHEEEVWDAYLDNERVEVDNTKPDWMYRGVFPRKERGEKTVTRGSLNVRVTPELLDALDTMIAEGKMKANYKFGAPQTPASPTERHDSISIYFLEEPRAEVLREIAAAAKPHVRGDMLIGRKVADGFFMSEIGSIEPDRIRALLEEVKKTDPAVAEAIAEFSTSAPPHGEKFRLGMSEGQFYAMRDVAAAFGFDISYDTKRGFDVKVIPPRGR